MDRLAANFGNGFSSNLLWTSLSPPSLVVDLAEVYTVLKHSDCDVREREHIGARLQMTAERMIRICQREMRVDDAVDDVPVHADQVGRRSGILDERVLGGKRPI